MCRTRFRSVATITAAQSNHPRIAGVAKQHGIAKRQQQMSRARIISSGRQIGRVRQRQKLSHVSVGVANRLAQAMPPELLVKLEKSARIESAGRIIKLRFKIFGDLRSARRKHEVQTPVLSDSFAGAIEEHFVFNDWSTTRQAVIPPLQEWRLVLGWVE